MVDVADVWHDRVKWCNTARKLIDLLRSAEDLLENSMKEKISLEQLEEACSLVNESYLILYSERRREAAKSSTGNKFPQETGVQG